VTGTGEAGSGQAGSGQAGSPSALAAVLDVEGPAAPPRRNGELVFAAPWESRAFGLAVALHAGGAFDWEDFRQQLMRAIAEWERDHEPDEPWSYYRCWLTALERVLVARGVVGAAELEARARELRARPAGHDHRHDGNGHGHDHDHEHGGQGHNGHDHG
jgi:nitrile hydratase accessory protein